MVQVDKIIDHKTSEEIKKSCTIHMKCNINNINN